MRVTKRISFRVLSLFLFSIVALSCNRGITPGVLRFSHFWSEPAQRAAMDSLLAGFHREHPEIPVEVTELSWADGKTKLMAGFNSETAPDVLELGSDWVAQFSSSGVLLQLDSGAGVGTSHAIMERFANAPRYALPSGMWGSHYFAVPWLLDTRVIFVNDDLLKSSSLAPHPSRGTDEWNWQTMQASAQAIGTHGIGVNGPDQHRLYKKFLPYVWSNGGDLFDSLGHPTMNLPQNIEALRSYVDQLNHGIMETQKNLDDAFIRGTLGIWFSGSWLLPRLANAPFRWHTELFPGNGGHEGESFAGGEYLAINAQSAMKREAELFLEYISRPDNELAFARSVNEYPADVRSQSDPFYLHRREGSVFTGQLAHARMTPVIPQWLDVEAIVEDEVSKALYKTETPEQAMTNMQRRTVALRTNDD
jgi:multiple sugar transport system substrate-binding protein